MTASPARATISRPTSKMSPVEAAMTRSSDQVLTIYLSVTPATTLIVGGGGNDALEADAGNDTITGGPALTRSTAAMTMTCSMARPARIQSSAARATTRRAIRREPENLTISLDGVANDGASGENDVLGTDIENLIGGTGNDTISGDTNNNTLTGGGGSDSIFGNDGDDSIDGGAANDTLNGGLGADSLTGGGGTDWVDYSTRTADLTITLDDAADDGESRRERQRRQRHRKRRHRRWQ